MKKLWILTVLLFLMACRNDEATLQNIDQRLDIYMKNSAGQDLLNAKIPGSYISQAFYDLGGARDRITLSSFNPKKDKDTVNYLEYFAGATRYLKDSVSPSQKTYESIIELDFNSTTVASNADADTMVIQYSWTPELFQISRVLYNRKEVFRKQAGQPNTVTIVK